MKKVKKSKIGETIILTMTICIISLSAYAKYSGSTGEPNDPYQINNEVIITIAGEEHHYIPQPELGYVVKIQQEDTKHTAELRELPETLLLPEYANPIGGLGHHGIWIVENKQPVEKVQNIRILLSSQDQYQYIAPLFSCNGDTVAVIPEIVVRVKAEIQAEQVQAMCENVGCSIIKPMEFTTQEYLLEVLDPDAEVVLRTAEQLNNMPFVEWAAPNTAFQPKLCSEPTSSDYTVYEQQLLSLLEQDVNRPGLYPNDEFFSMQWHLYNTGQYGGTPGADIHTPEAWEITTGDPNIVVAVLDSGIDSNHPDLIQNMLSGYDFFDNDTIPEPDFLYQEYYPHGTACAGLIAAVGNNGIGVTGVCWNCKIMPLRISGRNDSFLTRADIATAFRWAASNGADILSNSWHFGNNPNAILHSAIVDITKRGGIGRKAKGCLILASSGNENSSVKYPAAHPEVVAVGATDPNDKWYSYSDYGPELDIVTPSGNWDNRIIVPQWTTDVVGSMGYNNDNTDTSIFDYTDAMGGTSGACPLAAGVAALIMSIEPNLTSDEVRNFIERSAKDLGDPGRDEYYGWGRVDARAALDMVLAKRCDLNNNWKVDVDDFLILLDCWDTNDISGDIAPAAKRDGVVDINDFELFMQYWQTEIPEFGLIAHWKLDEEEGPLSYDSSGYYHDASLIDDPNWQPDEGMIDGAIELDGIDDYLSTPFIINPYEENFSVFAWIKGGTPGQVIISQQNGANWLSADPLNGCLMTDKGSGRSKELISEVVITDGDWHRVGLVWDGTNRILYVDDVMAAIIETTTGLISSEGGLYIGVGNDLEPGTFWSGLIDDIQIYNRAVTP